MTSDQKTLAAAGSVQEAMKVRYTAKTHASGGRRGSVSRREDGRFDVKFSALALPIFVVVVGGGQRGMSDCSGRCVS